MENNKDIYFRTDSTIHLVKSSLAFESAFLYELVKSNPDLGTESHPLMIDLDTKTFDYVIEVLRNGPIYMMTVPETELDIISKFISAPNTITQSKFIALNVSGEMFYTTVPTLSKASYFNSVIEWNIEISPTININRSHKAFYHILKYMRNSKYIIPEEYLYEDYFYGVFDNFNKCTNQWTNLNKQTVENQLQKSHPIDPYLIGNPQVTFHKMVYRRHTLFTRNNKQVIGTQINPHTIIYDIDTGDILNRMFLHFVPINPLSFITDLKIKKIELVADNDFIIDSNSWDFILMNMNLFDTNLKIKYLSYLKKNELYVPLFFNLNLSGLGVPLCSIKNKIRLHVTVERLAPEQSPGVTVEQSPGLTLENNMDDQYRSRLIFKYNEITGEEKRRFEQVSHEYLYQSPSDMIVQFDDYSSDVLLPFSGAIKWIMFKIESESGTYGGHRDLLLEADLFVNSKLYIQTDPLISSEDFYYGSNGKKYMSGKKCCW